MCFHAQSVRQSSKGVESAMIREHVIGNSSGELPLGYVPTIHIAYVRVTK